MILCKEKYAKELDKLTFPGIQGGPLMHVIAAKAVAFGEALQPAFKTYQAQVLKNAKAMAAGLEKRGFRIVSGGTDSHVFSIDLRPKGCTGKDAEIALGAAHITVNKNTIPFDPEKPFITSGVRLGSPAVTTRGMKELEMDQIAAWITTAVEKRADAQVLAGIKKDVAALCAKFPLYMGRLAD
jgi:glycine hydroxymethyltransferase